MLNKKNVVIGIMIAFIVIIIGILMCMLFYKEPTVEVPVIDTEVDTEVTESLTVIPDTEIVIPEQDRELKFDNYVKEDKIENQYIEESEIGELNPGKEMVLSGSETSGVLVQNSENIDCTRVYSGGLELQGADGTRIVVNESEFDTVQEARNNFLVSINFDYYLTLNPESIPLDSKFDETNGLVDWYQYFPELRPGDELLNPVVSSGNSLVVDTIMSTALGNTNVIMTYFPSRDTYTLHGFILCTDGRILHITILNTSREYATSYLYEITNDVITLIK